MTRTTPSAPPDWRQDLAPGERLIWTGRPEPGRRYSRSDLGMTLIGVMVTVFAIAWILFAVTFLRDPAMAPQAPLLGLVVVFCATVAVLSLVLARWLLWRGWLQRERDLERSFYALTDRRGMVRLTAPLPRFTTAKLTSLPILPHTMVEITGDPSRQPASVHFGTLATVDSEGDKTYTRIGFERIADAPLVWQLILDVQDQTQTRGPVASPLSDPDPK